MATTVVNIKCDEYDCYIGRGGMWGNPFIIGKDGTRMEVIEKYKKWLPTQPQLLALIPTLKDKRLACFCSPLLCHGDYLAALADKREPMPLEEAFPQEVPRKIINLSAGTFLDIQGF